MASARLPEPSEKVILDIHGKVVVPITDADYIRYLGHGIYMFEYWSTDPPFFYDSNGKRFSIKLPEGSTFVKILQGPKYGKESSCPPEDSFVCFTKSGKQGVSDFSGKIIMPAKYRSLVQYVGDRIVVVRGENPIDELVVKFDGTILADLSHHGGADDVWPAPQSRPQLTRPGFFTEGRRSVCHGAGTPCALMDLNGKVITDFKFLSIEPFENGIAVARLKADDAVISVFIDRQGNIVRRFPKGIAVEGQRGPNRYFYYTGSPSEEKQGVIDQNGKTVIPAEYFTLHFNDSGYYLGHRRKDSDELDIFDLNGKLLLHCPHQVLASDQLEPSSDKPVRLSTLQEFFASRYGATVTGVKDKDGRLCVGVTDSKGNWIIPAIYNSCAILNTAPDEVSNLRFACELPARAFSKEAWLRAEKYRHLGRGLQFNLFLKEHDLIGMSAKEVENFLGEPLSSVGGELSYFLSKRNDGQATTLYLRENEKGFISAWRYIYTSNGNGLTPRYESPWETRNMTFSFDKDGHPGQLVPKYRQSESR
jgi:hypothetical protein